MKRKILIAILVVATCIVSMFSFVACTNDSIVVVSRESGSGTRGAFEEILGIKESEVKATIISNSTQEVMTTIAKNKRAIGYISLGSLNDTVKSLKINGVEATNDNVLADTYKLARPFNLVTNKEVELSDVASEFMNFIKSKEAQEIISAEGYVATVSDATPYIPTKKVSGALKVSGSTSVEPLLQVLVDKFNEFHDGKVAPEISATGSGAGIKDTNNKTVEIGMVSRVVSDDEQKTLNVTQLCKDGIAVIVNKDNALNDITIENLAKIYKGEIKSFADIK